MGFVTTIRNAVLASAALVAVAVSARAQEWRPMDASEAHLSVAPSAFGTRGIQRWVLETVPARYERWATPIDPARRFFQLVLRESTGTTPISEDFDLQRFAAESLGSYAGGGIAWGASGQAATPLGTADYRHFSFSRISCVAFQTPYGGAVYGHPVNVLKGLYCDPAVPQIPQFDIEATLAAIDVVPDVGPGVSPGVR